MSVTYQTVVPVRDRTAMFVSSLLHEQRLRRGIRAGTRALTPYRQAAAGRCGLPRCVPAEHDTTALRTHPELLPALALWTGQGLLVLGDLGHEGEADTITVAFKKPKDNELTDQQKTHNKTQNGKRAVGERGNSLLRPPSSPTQRQPLPRQIGKIVAAASSSFTSTTTAPHDHPT
jgi:hypothetical protein